MRSHPTKCNTNKAPREAGRMLSYSPTPNPARSLAASDFWPESQPRPTAAGGTQCEGAVVTGGSKWLGAAPQNLECCRDSRRNSQRQISRSVTKQWRLAVHED